MQVKILNVDVENVVKGKSRYSMATVAYMFQGEARTQKIMSFANPDVFKKVSDYVGQEVFVTVTKNEGGYSQWSSINTEDNVGAAQIQVATGQGGAAPAAARVTGSNYETPAERASRQVYIVKQSSLSTAVALVTSNKEKATPEEIITIAQKFVDFVFDPPSA